MEQSIGRISVAVAMLSSKKSIEKSVSRCLIARKTIVRQDTSTINVGQQTIREATCVMSSEGGRNVGGKIKTEHVDESSAGRRGNLLIQRNK